MNGTAPERFDILIRGCTALTAEPGRPPIENAVIGIRGDRLALITTMDGARAVVADRVIDAGGFVATPGFVAKAIPRAAASSVKHSCSPVPAGVESAIATPTLSASKSMRMRSSRSLFFWMIL